MTSVQSAPARPAFTPGERVIEGTKLEVAYGEVQVVFGVNLHLPTG